MAIQVDETDIAVKCLNVSSDQVPMGLLEILEDYEPYEYMDTSDLKEHMYTVEGVSEKLGQVSALNYNDWLDMLQETCDKYECAYWRITKY
jgi:hypothetical protein